MFIGMELVLLFTIGCAAIFVDRSRSEAARLRLLVELSERLQLSPTIADAAQLLPSFAGRLFPHLHGAVYLSRSTTDMMRLAATWGDQGEIDVLHPDTCNALLRRSTHIVRTTHIGTTGQTSCEHAEASAGAEMICVPMLDAGETFGLFTLRAPNGTPLPNGIERIAEPFAHLLALTLSNLRLQETLRDAAVRDSLTGLFNRRCISESLTLELLNGGNPQARVGVILLDVDHFKQFNDTWGHGGGDVLLQRLARLMQKTFNGNDDIVCRHGGEEFVVVLPNISPAALRSRAECLLDRVRSLHIECNGQLVSGVTVSAGIAISPLHATNIDGLISAADRALYAAKSAGRNRVATPPPLVIQHTAAA
jgi:diguanylate cyclase (GGDEF)-like protein